jgi:hypothetical protein
MGDAAMAQNFTIQCERDSTSLQLSNLKLEKRKDPLTLYGELALDCMTLPIITMNSVSIHASTHQRLGPDYLDGSNRVK